MQNAVSAYLHTMQETLGKIDVGTIEQFIDVLMDARLYGRQVFIMGNGGSASTASHFVADLAKNTRRPNWPHFRVIGLTDNMAIFSAYANDEGYENVFAEQLSSLVEPQDIVIGISASGNSENVLRAIRLANKFGAYTVGLTGFSGGELAQAMTVLPRGLQATPALETDAPLEKVYQQTALSMATEKTSQRARHTMEMLSEISREFAGKLDLHAMLGRVLLLTLQTVGAISGSIMVLDGDGNVLDGALAYNGETYTPQLEELGEMASQGLASWVIENRQPALIANTGVDSRWLRRREDETERSVLSVPLVTQDRVAGVVTLGYPQAGRFTMEDLAMLTAVAVTLSYSLSEKQVTEKSYNK